MFRQQAVMHLSALCFPPNTLGRTLEHATFIVYFLLLTARLFQIQHIQHIVTLR
ncbi:hypothetical protein SAMN05421749_11153 [Acinetobacter marinus]|uniref:Uncharacterized protein n=1 Tax=Acinetobacter marinus TaxID=281375 RepID=A0A1G6NZ02_9GAMM|nr:hypothetical protein SAMN05421749_11153 [Acinetobacter marinus]